MGTAAIIWDRDPRKGGTCLGWTGGDGHPDRMRELAEASGPTGFRAAARIIAAKYTHWQLPQPGRWWNWPSDGLFVKDYGYWWDEERGCPVVVHYQWGPVPLTPELTETPEAWPGHNDGPPNPDLIGVPLPELFTTVDPRNRPAGVVLHRRSSARDDEGDAAEQLLERFGDTAFTIERPADAKGIGTWDQDKPRLIRVLDAEGTIIACGRHLPQAIRAGAHALRAAGDAGWLAPKDQMSHREPTTFLYSVEDLLREARRGTARIHRRPGRVYEVELDHPLAGPVRTSSDDLAEALLLARRIVLAAPGFRLENTPPYNIRHVGTDRDEAA